MRAIVGMLICMLFLSGCVLQPPEQHHPGGIIKISFSPDGKMLALVHAYDLQVYAWANGSPIGDFHAPDATLIDFAWTSNDVAAVAWSSGSAPSNYSLTYWDVKRNATIHSLNVGVGSEGSMSLAVLPSGQVALSYWYLNQKSASPVYGTHLINSQNYEIIQTIPFAGYTSYSTDGKYLEFASTVPTELSSYSFYSATTHSPVYNISMADIYKLVWSADGNQLVGIKRIDSEEETHAIVLFPIQDANGTFALGPPEEHAVTLGCRSIFPLDMEYSPDGVYLAIAGTCNTGAHGGAGPKFPQQVGLIDILETRTMELVFQDGGANGTSISFDWSPDGKLAYLYDTETISNLRVVGAANFTGG